jgi:hypothetical protein
MMRFEGDTILPGSPAINAARLADATYLVRRLPDLEKINSLEKTRANFTLRPGLSFVRGTIEANLEIREDAGDIVHLIKSKSIGATSEVEARLTPSDAGSSGSPRSRT